MFYLQRIFPVLPTTCHPYYQRRNCIITHIIVPPLYQRLPLRLWLKQKSVPSRLIRVLLEQRCTPRSKSAISKQLDRADFKAAIWGKYKTTS